MSSRLSVLSHVYAPAGTARELFAAREPEVLLSGPAGTGKSRACMEKLHACMMLNPGARGVILRKTAVSLTSTALVTFREHVAKEALLSGEVKFFGGSSQESASYRYANGSSITIGGMDKATRIMSSEYDMAYVQEATELTENDWESISTRLRHGVMSFQQIIADCNPDSPVHWLKQRCDTGRTRIFYCRHEDNPVLYAGGAWTPAGADYIGKLEALTGVRYQRLRLGLWAAADGLVYDGWDPNVHLVDSFTPPGSWERYWSIDFGYTNPFVCQMWAEDPDGRLYLHRELYRTQTLVEDHAKVLSKYMLPRAVICDHDAEGRATLERKLGCSTIPAHKSVLEGIEAVKGRMKAAGDGKPRLFIMRDALVERDAALAEAKKPCCTAEEMLGYVWGPGVVKEAPLKVDDHGLDAMRYMVAHRDLVGRPRIRVIKWLRRCNATGRQVPPDPAQILAAAD